MRAVLAAKGTASRITKYRRLPIHFFIAVKLIGRPSWGSDGESRHRHTWSQLEFSCRLPSRLTTYTWPRQSAMLQSGSYRADPYPVARANPKAKTDTCPTHSSDTFPSPVPLGTEICFGLRLPSVAARVAQGRIRLRQRDAKTIEELPPSGPDFPRSREVLVLYRKREKARC